MKFRATLRLEGKTATGIQVPPEVVTSLGSSKKPAVSVTVGGYTYRSTIAVLGGKFMIPVSADVRKHAKIAAGDDLDVNVELDTQPREISVPEDFMKALEKDAAAKHTFDGLSYSNKRRYTLSIEDAKTPETRQRRIEKAISELREG